MAGEQNAITNAEFQEAVAPFRGVFLTSEELIFTDEEIAKKSVEELTGLVKERAVDIYNQKEAILGEPLMRELERVMLLRVVDEYWMDHIDAMDDLKQGIRLRALEKVSLPNFKPPLSEQVTFLISALFIT